MHPRLFLNFCQEQKIDTHGVTEASIRTFIKEQKIGCISSRIQFRGTNVQVSAVHVTRTWFEADVIRKLDERECEKLMYFISRSALV